jgi:hypothetical protein
MKRRLEEKEMRTCFQVKSSPQAGRREPEVSNQPEHPEPCAVDIASRRHPPLYDYLVLYADDFMRDFGPLHA